ncbi:hypothetical protein ZWY2020_004244 [Hordeum vulgare]|nr:hypothetical protein ZWY2020_004244 [Hordeum vulgare]
MVIIRGDADGRESNGSSNQLSRRNLKRAAGRQTRSARSVQQGEEVEGVDQFRVVKRSRHATVLGGAASSSKAVVARGVASSSATTVAEGRGEGVEENAGEDADRPLQAGRIRTSPGQFAKLFGGMLNLADTLPADLTKYLVRCYKPGSSKMRATRRFRETFNITGNSHPNISAWCKMVQDMAGKTDDTFFIAWLAFLNIVLITEVFLFFCLFVRHILYLDALVHDVRVSNCTIRVNAWDSNLIAKVIKKDLVSPGVFGKLQLKEEYRGTRQTPLFGGLLQAQAFMASKLPLTYNPQKKAKIVEVVHDMCKSVTEQVGNFIEAVVKIDEEEPDIDPYVRQSSLQTSRSCCAQQKKIWDASRQEEEEEFVEKDDEMETEQDFEDANDTNEDESEEEEEEDDGPEEEEEEEEEEEVSVLQLEGETLGHQPICRSSSYTFHDDGYCDAPTFDLGIDGTTEPIAPAQIGEANLDSVRVNEACDAAHAGKGLVHRLDVASPDSSTPRFAEKRKVGTSSSSRPVVARRQRRIIRPGSSQRSPFIDYNKKKIFNSIETINKLFAALVYWVRNHPGANDVATK